MTRGQSLRLGRNTGSQFNCFLVESPASASERWSLVIVKQCNLEIQCRTRLLWPAFLQFSIVPSTLRWARVSLRHISRFILRDKKSVLSWSCLLWILESNQCVARLAWLCFYRSSCCMTTKTFLHPRLLWAAAATHSLLLAFALKSQARFGSIFIVNKCQSFVY